MLQIQRAASQPPFNIILSRAPSFAPYKISLSPAALNVNEMRLIVILGQRSSSPLGEELPTKDPCIALVAVVLPTSAEVLRPARRGPQDDKSCGDAGGGLESKSVILA